MTGIKRLRPGDRVNFDEGDILLVDAFGTAAIKTQPSSKQPEDVQIGLVLDIEGRWNKTEERGAIRTTMTTEQVGELMTDLMVGLLKAGWHPEGIVELMSDALSRRSTDEEDD